MVIEALALLFADLDAAARTVWGEARGESFDGQVAVACVMINRALLRHRGESRLAGVCTEPAQFSCWNKGDPNLAKLLATGPHDRGYRTALAAVLTALDLVEVGDDPTQGATHYHARAIAPEWAAGRMPCAAIDSHVFYNRVA